MQSDSTLNQLKASLTERNLPSSYGVYFKNTLVALCHALEDHILQYDYDQEKFKPLVLVTFQRGKWYLQEAERYEELAKYSRQVVICAMAESGFDTHKTSQLENVSLINLDQNDSLVEEWNLIILAPDYAAMLLCCELSQEEYLADSKPLVDNERKFYGLWTFDRVLVETATSIIAQKTRQYNPILADQVTNIQQEISKTPSSGIVDLTSVVNRIVNYLQSSQQELITVNRQTKEFWDLEGQALKLNRNLTANKLQAFLRMAQKVDENDPTNSVASLQVSALSETLGQLLDLPTLKLRRLRLAGLLFRVGFAEAPKEIFSHNFQNINSPSYKFWQNRSILGARLLSSMPELQPITDIVSHQLEYWDGSGAPDGLKGESIGIESRIIGLVSYFQELTNARGDRQAFSLTEALEKCQSYSGTRFDPNLIDSLSHVIRLTEMGFMQLPHKPSQLPSVWLEESC